MEYDYRKALLAIILFKEPHPDVYQDLQALSVYCKTLSSSQNPIGLFAKEGRKYGVFLGLVSQRPAELDPTIISQCNTLFAMRMANDLDQALLRSASIPGLPPGR